jgi:hypothetical protein
MPKNKNKLCSDIISIWIMLSILGYPIKDWIPKFIFLFCSIFDEIRCLKILIQWACAEDLVIGNFRFRYRFLLKFRFRYAFRFRFWYHSIFRFRPKFQFKIEPKTEICLHAIIPNWLEKHIFFCLIWNKWNFFDLTFSN